MHVTVKQDKFVGLQFKSC